MRYAIMLITLLLLTGCSFFPPVHIEIESTPSEAMVYLNDQFLGLTPLQTQVTPGVSQIRWEKDGYEPHVQTFQLGRGQPRQLSAELVLIGPVNLTVHSNPSGARVNLNGQFMGVTPLTIVTTHGQHQIELTSDGYQSKQEFLVLQGQTSRQVLYTLAPLPIGYLSITTQPQADTIRMIKPTSTSIPMGGLLPLAPGTYRIEVKKAGYNTANLDITIRDGQTSSIHYPFLPLRQRDDEPIQGPPLLTAQQMAAYLESILKGRGQQARINTSILQLAEHYIHWGRVLNVRGDVAFAQSIHETGFFQFGGDVKPEQNNYAGIGAVGGGASGASFPTPEIGVLAQIQHLYGYSTKSPLPAGMEIYTPRWHLINKGIAPNWSGLTGRYATDPQYHIKVWNHYTSMRSHAGL